MEGSQRTRPTRFVRLTLASRRYPSEDDRTKLRLEAPIGHPAPAAPSLHPELRPSPCPTALSTSILPPSATPRPAPARPAWNPGRATSVPFRACVCSGYERITSIATGFGAAGVVPVAARRAGRASPTRPAPTGRGSPRPAARGAPSERNAPLRVGSAGCERPFLLSPPPAGRGHRRRRPGALVLASCSGHGPGRRQGRPTGPGGLARRDPRRHGLGNLPAPAAPGMAGPAHVREQGEIGRASCRERV